MTPPILHVESDFDSPDETLEHWHHREHPGPSRRYDLVAVWLPGVGLGLSVALLLFCLRLLVIA